MKNEKRAPLAIALDLYKVATPIFSSLKEQYNPTNEKVHGSLKIKELTFSQLRILFAIEIGNNQVGKLARSARVAQPAMSKMVNHLINLGFARRNQHSDDRRQINLSLTTKGVAMTHKVRLNAAKKYVAAIKNLSATDRKKLVEGIEVILEVIEKQKGETK